MKFNLKKLFSSFNLKRFLSVFLCALILVFGMQLLQPLEAEAVTGVDDAIVAVLAVLACCGITFTTVEAANNMSTTWLNNMPNDILNGFINLGSSIVSLNASAGSAIIDTGFGIIDLGRSALDAGYCFVEFTSSEWASIYQSFCSSFPQYANLGHQTLNLSADIQQQIMSAGLYSYLVAGNVLELGELPVGVDVDVTFQTSSSSFLRYCGKEIIDNNYSYLLNDVYLQNSIDINGQYLLSSLPALDLVSFSRFSEYTSVVYPGYNIYYYTWSNKYGTYSQLQYDTACGSISSIDLLANTFFKGERVEFSQNEYGRCSLVTPTYGNLVAYWVSCGALAEESPLINCDDWTFKDKATVDGLLLGRDIFDVGIDIEHAPAIDGFPSQVGDVSDVDSYPDTIPLNIPTTLTDETIGDLTADKVRDTDITNTDTDDSSGTDTGNDKTKPKFPHTTIPEIIFKEKFPFCLPWDIYNLFVVLEAEAEAPRFEIPFKDEKLGIDETFVIDFSQFNEIAAIIRFFIGAGFVLALILISRKLTGSE